MNLQASTTTTTLPTGIATNMMPNAGATPSMPIIASKSLPPPPCLEDFLVATSDGNTVGNINNNNHHHHKELVAASGNNMATTVNMTDKYSWL